MSKRSTFVIAGTATLAAALLFSTQVISQENGKEKAGHDKAMAESMEMMEKWIAMNAKGPEHAELAKMVGKWDAENHSWMAPGAEPMVTKGSAEFTMILDGRYLQQNYKGDWMGTPFEGIGIEGYDRVKKKYVSMWIDSMTTGFYIAEGSKDKGGKSCTYFGKMDCPMTGEKDKVIKSVMHKISDDKLVFEMYDKSPEGKDFVTMKIIYTRTK